MPIANLAMYHCLFIATVMLMSVLENRIKLRNSRHLMLNDLLKAAEQKPKNLEIFMLIEELLNRLEKHN